MKKLDEIIYEHFMSLDFKQEEANPMAIAIFLRMKDVAKAYAESKCEEQRKLCAAQIDTYGGIEELYENGEISKSQTDNINFELIHNISTASLPKFD